MPPAASAELDVVIVSYNCRALLTSCLESLQGSGSPACLTTVHVVDNASTDDTAQLISRGFPDVRLTVLPENRGFSAANNVAIRETTAPFVLFLNPDTEVYPGTLDYLLGEMADAPDVGMIGCRLELPDGSFDHAAKRSFPTPTAALAHFTGIGRRADSSQTLAQYRAPDVDEHGVGDVDALNGAFMLVRREALDAVGLLDEGYWLYMEDLDWCRRFHLAGWRVLYDGRVSCLHLKGGTSGSHRRLRQNIAFHRGMARFYRRYEAGPRPLLDVAVYVGIYVKLALSVLSSSSGRLRQRFLADAR
jgi:GT2 family glycosyltransferase